MIITILSPSIATAKTETTINADEVIEACDRALNSCNKLQQEQKIQINLLTHEVKLQDDFTKTLLEVNQKQRDELNKWYRDPLIIGGVGFLIGMIIGSR
jgi:hypothetical protein